MSKLDQSAVSDIFLLFLLIYTKFTTRPFWMHRKTLLLAFLINTNKYTTVKYLFEIEIPVVGHLGWPKVLFVILTISDQYT